MDFGRKQTMLTTEVSEDLSTKKTTSDISSPPPVLQKKKSIGPKASVDKYINWNNH